MNGRQNHKWSPRYVTAVKTREVARCVNCGARMQRLSGRPKITMYAGPGQEELEMVDRIPECNYGYEVDRDVR